MKKTFSIMACFLAVLLLSACFGSKMASSAGGEVTGVSGRPFSEPTPYGMTLIKRGHLKMGIDKQDSLWGKQTPVKDISIEGFWMDEHEVTNSMYRQFVNYVRDRREDARLETDELPLRDLRLYRGC
jgi:formylglycine-generating enzyme required for sulfatase activity